MNLIDAGHMEEAELQRLSEDLQQVLGMLKYRDKEKELQDYIRKNEACFSSVDVETYQALCSFLNAEKGLKRVEDLRKGDKVNMCQALEQMYQHAMQEGREEGREAGIALARKVFCLSASGKTPEEIAEEAGLTPGEVRKILG